MVDGTGPGLPTRARSVPGGPVRGGAAAGHGRLEPMPPASIAVAPTDLDQGSFSDTPPWTLDDPTALRWRRGLAEVRARAGAEVPDADRPGALPPGRPARHGVPPPRRAPSGCGRCASGGAGGSHQSRPASRAGCGMAAERLGPTYIKLGQIISSRRGHLPRGAGRRVQAAAATRCRPSRSTTSARVVEDDLGRPLERGVRRVRPRRRSRRRRSPRCTRPRCVTGERGRGQGAAPAGRPRSSATTCAVMAWLAPLPRRPHPRRRAGQPAGARRAVRRDDRRGARLPPRGREHARHRPRRSPSSASGATSSPARTPTLVTRRVLVMERLDGLRVRRRRRHAATPASTPRRSCAPG